MANDYVLILSGGHSNGMHPSLGDFQPSYINQLDMSVYVFYFASLSHTSIPCHLIPIY